MPILGAMKRLTPRNAKMIVQRRIERWQLRGDAVECPLCGYEARRFADSPWHSRTVCPQCRTETRHRLLIAALKRLPSYSQERLLNGKRVLHFAPEAVIRRFVRDRAGQYASADFLRGNVDLRLDMTCMPEIADGSFDTCIACDVLEHVADDGAALRELHRVLAPGGAAIITVPQQDGLATTYEDPSITTAAGRLAAFGQVDHVRMYGDDVVARMQAAGFRVETVDANSFEPADAARFVLRPPVVNPHPLATNFRKVFFCWRN
jgi:SAM-dependent methyltransferase